MDGNPAGIKNSYLPNKHMNIKRYLEYKEQGSSPFVACGSCRILTFRNETKCVQLITFYSVPSTSHVVRDN
jgi:hypothetical protein